MFNRNERGLSLVHESDPDQQDEERDAVLLRHRQHGHLTLHPRSVGLQHRRIRGAGQLELLDKFVDVSLC